MTIPRLLVVDDDTELREMLTKYFQGQGFAVCPAATSAEISAAMERYRIDLILLDVMLGDESGLELCTQLRAEQDVPIIMVSALSSDNQRMQGYAAGADDYVAKPFNPDLLAARVKAVLRRGNRAASLTYRRSAGTYRFEGWSLDARTGEVRAPGGYLVSLSRREGALLKALLANPMIPLKREEIAEALDPDRDPQRVMDAAEGRAIDVLVGRLRGKLEANPKDPKLIRTERGVGYVLACEVTQE
ncbi:response regulator transcription factor [Donghicola sp.]|uniref:response regulator transcription factor n=1 Tax=Donghicola sp. TaxID=1929294 RepID=UPI0025F5E76E|nr:response regulator transcription factor [Donghicola sp.]MCT4576243.1 response regulator transcription factor [Donghicola sp.]